MNNRLLSYAKASVRVQVDAAGAFFAATDLFGACRRRTDRYCLARMAPEHLRLLGFPTVDGEQLRLTAVSPLGARTIAASLPLPLCRYLDGWVRRETTQLATEFGFPDLPLLSLLADGRMPVKPRASHDLYGSWMDLDRNKPRGAARAANLYEPALFDEDPSLPPHDPDTSRATVQALIAAGKRALAEEGRA